MTEQFDPYRKWLGIPDQTQHPHHYQLLGLALFEDDPDVIENAANRQMTHIRSFQTGQNTLTLSITSFAKSTVQTSSTYVMLTLMTTLLMSLRNLLQNTS